MSIKAMDWAWQQECQSTAEKLVLLALADHAGQDGSCFPGAASLGEKCGMAERTVRHHIDNLCSRGLLTKAKRRHREDGSLSTWLYQLNFTYRQSVASGNVLPEAMDCTPTGNVLPLDYRQCIAGQEPSVVEPLEEPSVVCSPGASTSHLPEKTAVDNFDVFWGLFPRKIGKEKVRKIWGRLKPAEREAAIAAVGEHCRLWEFRQTEKEFIPHPTTWLNQRRWEDDLSGEFDVKPKTLGLSRAAQTIQEMMKDATARKPENRGLSVKSQLWLD